MLYRILAFASQVIVILGEVLKYWYARVMQLFLKPNESAELRAQFAKCATFHEWHDVALQLDHLEGNDVWRSNPRSRDYDYKLISALALRMDQLRSQKRFDELTEVIRSGLVRNIGSIGSPELFSRAYAGTKMLVESYVHSVVRSLHALRNRHEDRENRFMQLQFFKDARQSYGRSALVLHGGSIFGLCHLGVVKSLLHAELLPHVVCGTTVGAIAAAFVASQPEHKLLHAINQLSVRAMAARSRAEALGDDEKADDGREQHQQRRMPLFTPEILWFHEFVHEQLGETTFEEAFARSGRCLSILVLEEGSETGTFFNYLTTPKVVVRTAVLASIGSDTLPGHHDVELLVKDYRGEVCPLPHASGRKAKRFLAANDRTFVPPRESPYTRLAELFNVNNYVVSVTRPYFAPFLRSESKYRGQPKLWRRAVALTCASAQYRISQLAEWGVISPWLKSMFIDEMIPPGFFQVNIVPESDSLVHDIMLAFDSVNIHKKVGHWIDLGERSVWPNVSIIWARTKIEYALNEICEQRDDRLD